MEVVTMSGNWEGDFWVDGDYRVARKFVEKYFWLYGPGATDPDHGMGNIELDDELAKILRKIDGFGGVLSTAGERHCTETAAYIAWNFVQHEDDIPPPPTFWISDAHYWFMTITAIRLAKKKKEEEDSFESRLQAAAAAIPWKKVIPIILAALAAGNIVLPDIITALLQAVQAVGGA